MTIQTTVDTASEAAASSDDKITCQICGALTHSIQLHLNDSHSKCDDVANNYTMERYMQEYPAAPVLSEFAKKRIAASRAAKNAGAEPAQGQPTGLVVLAKPMHEVFGLPASSTMNSKGTAPIAVSVLDGHDAESILYLPAPDHSYVFNIDLLKKVVMGFELNMPVYLWGMHGTGKTTILQQAAARTRRPFIRVQHTVNMQESDVLGQWTVRDGSTFFQLGPLAVAMINGWVYCADEYDIALPSVTALYQPVLEGQSLLIKDAPPQFRKITPHPNFRFVATGNTNGAGDETGLYQGTMVQNAANYSRFGITMEVGYMDEKTEVAVIVAKTSIPKDDAVKIIKFANAVRKMFAESSLSNTISPRELISAASLGRAFGGNFKEGLMLAFGNRMSRVDKKVIEEYLQRSYG